MFFGKSDFMGGIFDFNGDGKTDMTEEFMAYMMFEELTKKKKQESESLYDDLFDSSDDDEEN